MMPCDYEAMRKDNEVRYGQDIGRIGRMLLSDRYDDRTHFIYELLQNAEDALARRIGWNERRVVSFDLDSDRLRVSHFGVPFDENDVVGVCGIGQSTKDGDLTAIGRFGIGFKSVYAFSDRPEVHSGSENFAIENYVWPVAVEPAKREEEETVILIPLRVDNGEGKAEIVDGLSRLGASSLLFLREIEEIRWRVDEVLVGRYLRHAEDKAPGIRAVTVVGQKDGESEVGEEWLVFSRKVCSCDGESVGNVEVAWSVTQTEDGRTKVQRAVRSQLVAFFPTAIETGLGFLVQGPYRTTPSRDNVPPRNSWNRTCVRETALLLVESMRWLRDHAMLDATALMCLPLDPERFEDSMFIELFNSTKDALSREDFLPTSDDEYVSAKYGRLSRTRELRELLNPRQLGLLEGATKPLKWLDGQISQDRTPALREYLMRVLDMSELTPEALPPRLSQEFLENEGDEWIEAMYEFFGSQVALRRRVASLPVVRLADGTHVPPEVDGNVQAFLPSAVDTDFPTVRRTVCQSELAREFLKSLNLTEPDRVDNVIRNVLPKYRTGEAQFSTTDYASDIDAMLSAWNTDSNSQREKLVEALREIRWVRSVDSGREQRLWAKPVDVYVATSRLRELYEGVEGVLFVDSRIDSLRGESIRELLERSGAARYLRTVEVKCDLSSEKLQKIRREEGLERSTWGHIDDKGINGIEALLERFQTLETLERENRSASLWKALGDLRDKHGQGVFQASYKWTYHQVEKIASFDSAFVRILNEKQWIADSSGELHEPASMFFQSLGWQSDPFLESKIRFKLPVIERLAQEAGIEPDLLDLLHQLGVRSKTELLERLGLGGGRRGDDESEEGMRAEHEGDRRTGRSSRKWRGDRRTLSKKLASKSGTSAVDFGHRESEGSKGGENPPELRFVSYVGVFGEGRETDPNSIEHADRMNLEADAIEFVLHHEPDWQRTPPNNPGFDLYRGATLETAKEWCEIKAMTGTLTDRPVGMSRTQFEWAWEHGEAYWLYVVENAGSSSATVVRIQNPAGKAMAFTFDQGWRAAASEKDVYHEQVL